MQEMANKYADTVEENRKLYNEVQDLKGNIRVFCRIRPLGTTGDSNPSCLDAGVDGEVLHCSAPSHETSFPVFVANSQWPKPIICLSHHLSHYKPIV